MWLFDKLMNRKIEGKSSLDNVEPLLEKVVVDVYDDEGYDIELPDNVRVEGKRLSLDSYNQNGVEKTQSHIDYHVVEFENVSGSAVDTTHISSNGLYHSYVVQDDNDPINNVVDIGDNGNVGGAYISVVDNVSGASTEIIPEKITITGNNSYISVTDDDKYVDIGTSYIEMGDSDEDYQINIESNDTVRSGIFIPQSRGSVISNIPELVDSVYDFGAQSTGVQVSLASRGKYTFTELKGSNNGNGTISITIVLPSFVKEVVKVGSDASSIGDYDITQPSVVIPLLAGQSVDQRGESAMNISVLITDYIAYIRYHDNQ